MPKRTLDIQEEIESVKEVLDKFIPNPRSQHHFFKSLQDRLNCDDHGKISFKPHVLASRRRLVFSLFKGNNHKEIANEIGVSVDTVYNDLNWLENQKRLRRKK
jgi:DNA-binding NarL/FixJ family response regulator